MTTSDDCTMGRDELWAEVQRLRAEVDKQHELLDRKAEHPFASDQESDVDYWRMKARDHWDAAMGASVHAKEVAGRLAKFEEREALVQVLVDAASEALLFLEYHGSPDAPALRSAMECVRDFAVKP